MRDDATARSGLRKVPLSRPERRAELFDAVLARLSELGYERLTMDLVARRARVGKATLYQRWPTKARLVMAAMERYRPAVSGRDAGSFTEDIRQLLMVYVASWSSLDRGLVIALLEGGRRDAELARLRRERFADPVRRSIEAALDRARERGEIPGRVDAGLLADLPFAIILGHVLMQDEPPGHDLVDRFVDGILSPLLDVPTAAHAVLHHPPHASPRAPRRANRRRPPRRPARRRPARRPGSRAFTLPIPSLVICELLGVPYADRARFHAWSAALLSITADAQQVAEARDALLGHMRELVAAKRRSPDDALLGSLITSGAGLSDAELSGIGRLLLVAGHETTANMLALGTLTLLTRPGRLDALRGGPQAAGPAVEELLRYLSILQFGIVRVAKEDVEIHGHPVRAGQTVVLSLPAANRDPEHFENPDELDVTRPPSQHVAFGHGIHQCLGQQLARVEMRIALTALFDGLPGLCLAVPPDEVPMRHDMFVYGVHRLPVSWER